MSRGAEKTRVPLLMRDRSFYHTFLILAGTLILEQAVVLSVNLADNLMIGSYNETALAAVAAVNQIVFVVQQVIYGVTNGVIVLSSQYWGKQQTAPIRRLVCLGLRLEAALSMLFFAVVSLWPALSLRRRRNSMRRWAQLAASVWISEKEAQRSGTPGIRVDVRN